MRNSNSAYARLLANMCIGPLGEHQKGGSYIEYPGNGFNRICLYEYENAPHNTFSLVVCSGDTCQQSRELYQHFTYEKAIDLKKRGWSVGSHFHFAWQRKNILFTQGDKALSLREYIDYWKHELRQGTIRKYNIEEFGLLQKRMRDAKIMNEYDIKTFDEFFRTHKYQSAITCPGIVNWISYSKKRLNEEIEILSAELKEKTMALVEIYN